MGSLLEDVARALQTNGLPCWWEGDRETLVVPVQSPLRFGGPLPVFVVADEPARSVALIAPLGVVPPQRRERVARLALALVEDEPGVSFALSPEGVLSAQSFADVVDAADAPAVIGRAIARLARLLLAAFPRLVEAALGPRGARRTRAEREVTAILRRLDA